MIRKSWGQDCFPLIQLTRHQLVGHSLASLVAQQ